MSIYNIVGTSLVECYNVVGNSVSTAYDVIGTEVYDGGDEPPDIPVEPMSWNMSESYKTQVLNALDEIDTYQKAHPNSYSICQFNDVHEKFSGNEPNFIDYNKGYKTISRMLFLGDMVNNGDASAYNNSVRFMTGASASKRVVVIGNHEYGGVGPLIEGSLDPDAVYQTAINVDANYMQHESNPTIYYNDDLEHNVRYIALDYYYITRTHYDNDHYLDAQQLEWCANTMESAGSMDVIICAHSMINPFIFMNTGVQASSSATVNDQQDIIDLINAYKNRETYSVTVDGVVHQHDFSNCTGNFIMYTSGHYHALGHYDNDGFHMFTCPAMAAGAYGGGQYYGFTFYVIDPPNRKIKVLSIIQDDSQYLVYDLIY